MQVHQPDGRDLGSMHTRTTHRIACCNGRMWLTVHSYPAYQRQLRSLLMMRVSLDDSCHRTLSAANMIVTAPPGDARYSTAHRCRLIASLRGSSCHLLSLPTWANPFNGGLFLAARSGRCHGPIYGVTSTTVPMVAHWKSGCIMVNGTLTQPCDPV